MKLSSLIQSRRSAAVSPDRWRPRRGLWGILRRAVYSYAKNAVSLGTYGFGSALPAGFTTNDLKATLADVNAEIIGAKYVYGPFKAVGGYEYSRYSNPTDGYAASAMANGFETLEAIGRSRALRM